MTYRVLLPTGYAALFAAALAYLLTHATQTPMAGVFAMLLTLPWSLLAIFVMAIIAPGLFDSSLGPGLVIVSLCAVVNAGMLIFVGVRLDRTRHRP